MGPVENGRNWEVWQSGPWGQHKGIWLLSWFEKKPLGSLHKASAGSEVQWERMSGGDDGGLSGEWTQNGQKWVTMGWTQNWQDSVMGWRCRVKEWKLQKNLRFLPWAAGDRLVWWGTNRGGERDFGLGQVWDAEYTTKWRQSRKQLPIWVWCSEKRLRLETQLNVITDNEETKHSILMMGM